MTKHICECGNQHEINSIYRIYTSDKVWSFVDIEAASAEEAVALYRADLFTYKVKFEEDDLYDDDDVIKIELEDY